MDIIWVGDYNFSSIDKNHFVWLPLKNVPISEAYPINSLEQPVLSIFKLAKLDGNSADLALGNQQYLIELASKYDEMGYFIFHHEGCFGIIGVTQYNGNFDPSFKATIFNACQVNKATKIVNPTTLKMIYSSIRFPYKELVYEKGSVVDYFSIHSDAYPSD